MTRDVAETLVTALGAHRESQRIEWHPAIRQAARKLVAEGQEPRDAVEQAVDAEIESRLRARRRAQRERMREATT